MVGGVLSVVHLPQYWSDCGWGRRSLLHAVDNQVGFTAGARFHAGEVGYTLLSRNKRVTLKTMPLCLISAFKHDPSFNA